MSELRGFDRWLDRGLDRYDDDPEDLEESDMKRGDVFQSNFLKAEDILGRAVRVTVENVVFEEIKSDDGKERKAVMSFVGKDKRFILNLTNWNTMVSLTGAEDSDHWRGWTITLYTTKVPFGGRTVDALRIDDRPGAAIGPQQVLRGQAPMPPMTRTPTAPAPHVLEDGFQRLRDIAAARGPQPIAGPGLGSPVLDEWARAEQSAQQAIQDSQAEQASTITDDDIPF